MIYRKFLQIQTELLLILKSNKDREFLKRACKVIFPSDVELSWGPEKLKYDLKNKYPFI